MFYYRNQKVMLSQVFHFRIFVPDSAFGNYRFQNLFLYNFWRVKMNTGSCIPVHNAICQITWISRELSAVSRLNIPRYQFYVWFWIHSNISFNITVKCVWNISFLKFPIQLKYWNTIKCSLSKTKTIFSSCFCSFSFFKQRTNYSPYKSHPPTWSAPLSPSWISKNPQNNSRTIYDRIP